MVQAKSVDFILNTSSLISYLPPFKQFVHCLGPAYDFACKMFLLMRHGPSHWNLKFEENKAWPFTRLLHLSHHDCSRTINESSGILQSSQVISELAGTFQKYRFFPLKIPDVLSICYRRPMN